MLKRISAVVIILVLFIAGYYFGTSGRGKNNIEKRTRILFGTTVEILIRDSSGDKNNLLFEGAFKEFCRIDSLFSAYLPESPVSLFNNSDRDTVFLTKEVVQLLKLSGEFNNICKGGFDVSLGRLNEAWGFSGQSPRIPDESILKKAIYESGWKYISIINDTTVVKRKNVYLDFSAIAKGYAVDKAFNFLKESGLKEYLINAGGEIRAAGKDWNIGIQDPDNQNSLIIALKPDEISDEISVATSGDYENFFIKDNIRYHHILDPVTGFPSGNCRSVTILAKDVTTADALATGIFVTGPEEGIKIIETLPGVECYIIDINGNNIMSSGFIKYIRK